MSKLEFIPEPPGAGRRGPIDLVTEGIRSRALAAAEDRPAPTIVVVAAGHDDAPVSYLRLAAAIAGGIAVGTLIATATIDFAVSRCAWPGIYCEVPQMPIDPTALGEGA